jgi:YesN/AraC family two-component response regulator
MNTNLIDNTNKQLKEICFEMNLLLVEDDAILLGQLKNLLGRFFGRVDTALNGREAFITYHERHYDLIITDLTMPVLDGIELTRNVKAVNRQQNILVLSAHSESEKLLELISIGIDGFMVKPVNIQVVLTQLAKTCQAIYDHKILDYYSAMLEETNKSLLARNTELDRSLSELTKLRILQEECQETKPKRALESEEIQEGYEV